MNFVTELSQKVISSFKRFPLSLAIATFGSFFLIGIHATDDYEIIKQYNNLSLVLILSISWFIALQFVSETLEHKMLYRFLLKVIALAGLVGFYFYLEKSDSLDSSIPIGQWALLLLAGHIFVIFAPFLNSWNKDQFWNYLKTLAIAVVRSTLYSLILYLGLALAITALEFLFDVDFNSYIYLQIFIFCLGIVNTYVYLSDFPVGFSLKKEIEFNKAIEVLIKYILIPLSLMYLLIVYVYAIQILVSWELPRGWVTYLITALSLLGFVIHIAIEPVRKIHDSKLIRKFFPFYFYAIIPLLPLLFIALYKRIADYNFTELRYLGLVLALWIAGMLLYMLISKQKRLSLYAKSMFLLILLSTFGPLSAFKISINAQLNELEELIESLNSTSELSFNATEYNRFESIVRYLDNRNTLDKTEAYFGFNPKIAFSETGSYGMSRKIVDSLNIKINSEDEKSEAIEARFTSKVYRIDPFKSNFSEEITEYTNFTLLKLNDTKEDQNPLQLYFDEDNIISLRHYGETLFETNLTSHLKAKADKYDYLSQASPDEFTFRLKNEKGDFLIIFQEFLYNYKERKVEIKSGKAMLFYRTYESLELP